MERSCGILISLIGVGATSLGAGFMLRSMSGGGDMGGEAAGTITWREGAGAGMGRGLGTPTGGAEGLVAEGGGAPPCAEAGVLTPDIADAQEVRCVMRREDTAGSNAGEEIRKDCTCCAAATNPC